MMNFDKIRNRLILLNKIPEFLFKNMRYQKKSFSQEGEDLILLRLFEEKKVGFYVDIGAHHPQRFSNTFLFYQRNWHGINIDPIPGMKRLFDKERPRDINLEIGISNISGKFNYHLFNDPALNTFDPIEAAFKNGIHNGRFYIQEIIEVENRSLTELLDIYLIKDKVIDFFTIDVEGLELSVLESNNWSKYRPTYLLVEELRKSLKEIQEESKVNRFLESVDYQLSFRTVNTSFYKDVRIP